MDRGVLSPDPLSRWNICGATPNSRFLADCPTFMYCLVIWRVSRGAGLGAILQTETQSRGFSPRPVRRVFVLILSESLQVLFVSRGCAFLPGPPREVAALPQHYRRRPLGSAWRAGSHCRAGGGQAEDLPPPSPAPPRPHIGA